MTSMQINSQLTTILIDEDATSQMARILHQNRFRRADVTLAETDQRHEWRDVEWTSPWLFERPTSATVPRPYGTDADRPATTVRKASQIPEGKRVFDDLRTRASALAPDAVDDESLQPDPHPQDRVRDALGLLGDVWPEALVEVGLLIREVIFVEAIGLRSCSFFPQFGAIFVGDAVLENTTKAFEMLLHETGHHSLFMRNAFAKHVENPRQLTTHPLRPDPRPVEGAVHAVFALARMVEGLRRLSRANRTDNYVQARLRRNLWKLDAGMTLLAEVANWTPIGCQVFADARTIARAAHDFLEPA